MNSKTATTFEYIRTGQEQPYGDTVTEGILTVEMAGHDGKFRAPTLSEEWALKIASCFAPWYEKDDPDPFSPRLESFEALGGGRYRIVTRRMYDD